MSVLALIFAALFLALGVWITHQTDWPQPIKWFVYAAMVVICIVAALKLLGIDLGHA